MIAMLIMSLRLQAGDVEMHINNLQVLELVFLFPSFHHFKGVDS